MTDITVTELITKRNAMGKRIIDYINSEMSEFVKDTGVDIIDMQLSILDASTHSQSNHFIDRVYILLDI